MFLSKFSGFCQTFQSAFFCFSVWPRRKRFFTSRGSRTSAQRALSSIAGRCLLARVLGILAAGVRHQFLAGVGTGEGIVLCPPFSWRGSAHFVCIGIPAAGQFGRSLQETIPAKRKFQPHQTGAGPAQIGRFQGGQIIVGHPLEARVRALAGVFFSARVSKAASFKKPPPLASPRA